MITFESNFLKMFAVKEDVNVHLLPCLSNTGNILWPKLDFLYELSPSHSKNLVIPCQYSLMIWWIVLAFWSPLVVLWNAINLIMYHSDLIGFSVYHNSLHYYIDHFVCKFSSLVLWNSRQHLLHMNFTLFLSYPWEWQWFSYLFKYEFNSFKSFFSYNKLLIEFFRSFLYNLCLKKCAKEICGSQIIQRILRFVRCC